MSIAQKLRDAASNMTASDETYLTATDLDRAAEEIDRLTAEVKRLTHAKSKIRHKPGNRNR